MRPEFWAGRSVLVTGHTGFKGSWLCWWLDHVGAKVAGFALDPPTAPSLFELSGLAGAMISTNADIRRLEALESAFQNHRPEIVIHMAAQSLVRESYQDPVNTFETNVIGTLNCLESARRCDSVRAVVVVSSDKCYRNHGSPQSFCEGDELGGDDPYAASKACAELVANAYRRSFFETQNDRALVATARAGNVIGGGDWGADRLVPDAMRAFVASQPLRIRNPRSIRPWQHVLEPLRGYLMLAEKLCAGERSAATAWNFGPDPAGARTVSWVADELARRWGSTAEWRLDGGEGVHEAVLLALDSGKAQAELGWRPLLTLDDALDWVTEWHKDLERNRSAREVTIEQIGRYQAMSDR